MRTLAAVDHRDAVARLDGVGDVTTMPVLRVDAQGRWQACGRVPARADVLQVGPLLSPRGERLLFAQADGARSGGLFLIDLVPGTQEDWPPRCGH